MHPVDKEDLSDLLVLTGLAIVGIGFLFTILWLIFATTPTFQYTVNNTTKISVSFEDCVTFGQISAYTDHKPLTYTQNGVEKTLDLLAPQISDQPAVKACVAALVQKAKDSQRFKKPLTIKDNFLENGIHPRFELSYKDNAPFITSYYVYGVKLRSVTIPVESCVNPQLDGPDHSTICQQLSRVPNPDPKAPPCGKDVIFCKVNV